MSKWNVVFKWPQENQIDMCTWEYNTCTFVFFKILWGKNNKIKNTFTLSQHNLHLTFWHHWGLDSIKFDKKLGVIPEHFKQCYNYLHPGTFLFEINKVFLFIHLVLYSFLLMRLIKEFLRLCACAFKFSCFRSTRCLRFSYVTTGTGIIHSESSAVAAWEFRWQPIVVYCQCGVVVVGWVG